MKAVDKELLIFVGHRLGQGEGYSAGGKCFVGTSQAGVRVFCQAQSRPVQVWVSASTPVALDGRAMGDSSGSKKPQSV